MKRLLSLIFVMAIASYGFTQNIVGSAHDFSGNGWSGGQICIVCHTPHNADITVTNSPLWNHQVTSSTYTPYTSATLDATVAQPNNSSKLCLSCHDGTVAVDNFGGTTTGTNYVGAAANFGTDLTNDHPISFTYNTSLATTDGGLFDPSTQNSGLGGTIAADMLFAGTMECGSCHDVHNASGLPNLLVKSNASSGLCLTCHDK